MELRLSVLSLRYSSWSIRPWLALTHAGARFETESVEVPMQRQGVTTPGDANAALASISDEMLRERRTRGSVTGLFPVLYVGDTPIHESLAICEWVAEAFPSARLWPADALDRARARSISCEMATGFANLRKYLQCHVFARVPRFEPNPATQKEIARVFEIWEQALTRSGGPFLFGHFTLADAMYFPVRTRFRTYGVELPPRLAAYARALDELPAVVAWERVARSAPRIPVYDEHLRSLGGDPDAAL